MRTEFQLRNLVFTNFLLILIYGNDDFYFLAKHTYT